MEYPLIWVSEVCTPKTDLGTRAKTDIKLINKRLFRGW